MVLPSWPRDRHTTCNSSWRAQPGSATQTKDVVVLISNVTKSELQLFRCPAEYELFRDLAQHHLGKVAEPVCFLFTPVSYELLLKFRLMTESRLNPAPDFRPVAAMLTHFVRTVHRKHQGSGGIFPRGFRKIQLCSPSEQHEAIAGLIHAAKAMESAFEMPVFLGKSWKE